MGRSVAVSGTDAVAAESSGSFVYPAGEYIGEIIKVDETKFAKQGQHKDYNALNVKVRFTESGTGVGEGKKFVAWNVPDFPKFASGKSAWLFYQLYKALGVVFPEGDGDVDLPDFEDILEQEIGLRLEIEDSKNAAGEITGKRNRVVGFFPAKNGVKESKAPAAGAAGAEDDPNFTL